MTLLPGDVITTGTPPGVALGMKPPVWLKAGDVMTLGIDGLGDAKAEGRAVQGQTLAPAPRTRRDARL